MLDFITDLFPFLKNSSFRNLKKDLFKRFIWKGKYNKMKCAGPFYIAECIIQILLVKKGTKTF